MEGKIMKPASCGGTIMNAALAAALSRHAEVMVVERSDASLELDETSLLQLIEDLPGATASIELNADERRAVLLLGEAWNACVAALPLASDRQEACADIHRLQNRILAQPTLRSDPAFLRAPTPARRPRIMPEES